MRIVMSKRLIYLLKLFRLKSFLLRLCSHSFVFFSSYYPKVILNCFRPLGKKNLFLCFFMSDPRFSYFCQYNSHFDNIISWNNDLRYRPWLCRKYSVKHLCCKKRLSRYVTALYWYQLESLI